MDYSHNCYIIEHPICSLWAITNSSGVRGDICGDAFRKLLFPALWKDVKSHRRKPFSEPIICLRGLCWNLLNVNKTFSKCQKYNFYITFCKKCISVSGCTGVYFCPLALSLSLSVTQKSACVSDVLLAHVYLRRRRRLAWTPCTKWWNNHWPPRRLSRPCKTWSPCWMSNTNELLNILTLAQGKRQRDWWSNFTVLWLGMSNTNFIFMKTGFSHSTASSVILTTRYRGWNLFKNSLTVKDLY